MRENCLLRLKRLNCHGSAVVFGTFGDYSHVIPFGRDNFKDERPRPAEIEVRRDAKLLNFLFPALLPILKMLIGLILG